MESHWTQLIWTLYALSYMVLGVSVAARAAAFPSSVLRNRLLCLAAFSIFHSLYDWTILANDLSDGSMPRKLRYIIEGLSFLPLWYFATGWYGTRARSLQLVLAAVVAAVFGVAVYVQPPEFVQLTVHLGLAIPAGIGAARALLWEPVFRPHPESSELALKVAAYSLLGYTATQLVMTTGSAFPANFLNSHYFGVAFGVSPFAVRVVLAVVFMTSTLMLLNRFDEALRLEAEKHAAATHKALRVTEAKLADILRMSPEGIVITDGTGRIEMFSAGAETIFGWRAEEAIGQNVEILMPQRFREMHKNLIESFVASRVANRPRANRPEVVGLRRDGEEFPLAASLSKISVPDGILITTIVRDITKPKREAEELMNAKLQAEEASKAKSRFIANMSHELRTPLNAILGFSELLGADSFARRRVEYAKLIHGAGEHLLTLINDILDLAKIEAGKFTLRETVFDFAALVRTTAEMMVGKAKVGGVTLTTEVARHLPQLQGDERALKQVLLNLVANAVKFTPAGGKVAVFARIDSNGAFRFGVRDTGVGIAEEEQAKLFDGFGTGRHDAITGEKGTGLGLPIARGLVLAHGGAIELLSRPGEGTTVTVTLPAERVRARHMLGVVA